MDRAGGTDRCYAQFTTEKDLKRKDMQVDSLNCPNCGAGVASDSSQCPFCLSRLKTVACPVCFKLMFAGAEFCVKCGNKAVDVSVGGAEDRGTCPRCHIEMEVLSVCDVELDECRKCGGLWADSETFTKICSDREGRAAVLGYIGRRELKPEPLSQISYVPCPACGQLMNRSNFARVSGVIIDICKLHGAWFDADELPKIIEFIEKGGMELSRRRERAELAEERSKLRDEERRIAGLDRRSGFLASSEGTDELDFGSIIERLFSGK